MLDTCITTGIHPTDASTRRVERAFHGLLAQGFRLRPAGSARRAPRTLLARGYTPKHEIRLFDTRYYLTQIRENQDFRFFVAWVRLARGRALYPRIFYKDSSLVWRSATHFVRSETENWIGKGDLRPVLEGGEEIFYSCEETTNLPLEIQAALDEASRRAGRVRRDERALELVLRRGPDDRVLPYRDFCGPRARAAACPRNLPNRGRSVARFARQGDPGSLRFVPGFEPDFARGFLEVSHSKSRLYGGDVRKFRILSRNRGIQYQFVAAPHHVWIVPPQTLSTEIISYGVRSVDVVTDEDLCVPGYEYHYLDDSESPPRFYSQIPPGFAGPASDVDPSRADASPWLEELPVIRAFRKAIGFPRPARG